MQACLVSNLQALDAKLCLQNTECGVALEGFNAFQQGDILQCFTITSKPQSPEGVANLQYASK